MTVINTSNNVGKAQLQAREDKKSAYHDLILANPSKAAFNLIDKSVMTNLLDGSAHMAWKKLSAKYNSHSSTAVVELQNDFNESN